MTDERPPWLRPDEQDGDSNSGVQPHQAPVPPEHYQFMRPRPVVPIETSTPTPFKPIEGVQPVLPPDFDPTRRPQDTSEQVPVVQPENDLTNENTPTPTSPQISEPPRTRIASALPWERESTVSRPDNPTTVAGPHWRMGETFQPGALISRENLRAIAKRLPTINLDLRTRLGSMRGRERVGEAAQSLRRLSSNIADKAERAKDIEIKVPVLDLDQVRSRARTRVNAVRNAVGERIEGALEAYDNWLDERDVAREEHETLEHSMLQKLYDQGKLDDMQNEVNLLAEHGIILDRVARRIHDHEGIALIGPHIPALREDYRTKVVANSVDATETPIEDLLALIDSGQITRDDRVDLSNVVPLTDGDTQRLQEYLRYGKEFTAENRVRVRFEKYWKDAMRTQDWMAYSLGMFLGAGSNLAVNSALAAYAVSAPAWHAIGAKLSVKIGMVVGLKILKDITIKNQNKVGELVDLYLYGSDDEVEKADVALKTFNALWGGYRMGATSLAISQAMKEVLELKGMLDFTHHTEQVHNIPVRETIQPLPTNTAEAVASATHVPTEIPTATHVPTHMVPTRVPTRSIPTYMRPIVPTEALPIPTKGIPTEALPLPTHAIPTPTLPFEHVPVPHMPAPNVSDALRHGGGEAVRNAAETLSRSVRGHAIEGLASKGTLRFDGKTWQLMENGGKNMRGLIEGFAKAGKLPSGSDSGSLLSALGRNKEVLGTALDKATALWEKGDLKPDSAEYALFHLANGTQSVYNKLLQDPATVTKLASLGLFK